jgi:hypothetical protein
MTALGYRTARGPIVGVDSAIDEEELVAAYMSVFGGVRLSVRLEADADSDSYSSALALALATSLAAAIPMTYAMGRTEESKDARVACAPHLTLVLTAESSIPSPENEEDLLRRVRAGARLSALHKARLLALPCLKRRVACAIAWVTNRCRRTMSATKLAALPLLYRPLTSGPGGTLHANLLSLRLGEGGTAVELFEPNGPDAFLTGGLSDILVGALAVLAREKLAPQEITITTAGQGLQTALGAWTFSRDALEERGYPVCAAVCVWAFSLFSLSGAASLREFDRELYAELTQSPEARHEFQLRFLAYMRALSLWNQTQGRGQLEAALRSHFRSSNVRSLRVARAGASPLSIYL